MTTEVGLKQMEDLKKMEEYRASIEKIGKDIRTKNSKKNLEVNRELKATNQKCQDMLSSYSEAFNIHD